MENQIQVFEHADFGRLEILTIDGKPYFPAKECAEILGYSKSRNAIDRHCPHALKRGVGVQTGEKADGSPAMQMIEKTFIPEGDLYRLVIRSKLPEAIRFEAWVCDTVLPSIRKYGSYITSEVLERLLSDPELASTYFSMLKTERDKNAALEEQIVAIEPIVSYHDLILQCAWPIPISVIAKDYGMTAIAFNKLLYSFGIQYKVGGTWLLYKEYMGQGYTVSKTYRMEGRPSAIHTYWTQKGRKLIYDALKYYGILPQVERQGIQEVCQCRT